MIFFIKSVNFYIPMKQSNNGIMKSHFEMIIYNILTPTKNSWINGKIIMYNIDNKYTITLFDENKKP